MREQRRSTQSWIIIRIKVIAFDSNSNISFLGCGMALWIGKQISGPEGLFYSDKAAFEAKGAKICMELR